MFLSHQSQYSMHRKIQRKEFPRFDCTILQISSASLCTFAIYFAKVSYSDTVCEYAFIYRKLSTKGCRPERQQQNVPSFFTAERVHVLIKTGGRSQYCEILSILRFLFFP